MGGWVIKVRLRFFIVESFFFGCDADLDGFYFIFWYNGDIFDFLSGVFGFFLKVNRRFFYFRM